MAWKKHDDELLMEEDLTADFVGNEIFGMPSDATTSGDTTLAPGMESDGGETAIGQLAVDVYETKEKLVVRSRVAGVNKTDLDVNLVDNTLSIRGTLSASSDDDVENYFGQECYWGEFSREIDLPVPVKQEDIEAVLRDGILTISFTKLKPTAVKKIQIQ